MHSSLCLVWGKIESLSVSSCRGRGVCVWGVWKVNEWWFLPCLIGEIRSSVGMLAEPFRPLYKRISLLSLHFLIRSLISFFFFFVCFFSQGCYPPSVLICLASRRSTTGKTRSLSMYMTETIMWTSRHPYSLIKTRYIFEDFEFTCCTN